MDHNRPDMDLFSLQPRRLVSHKRCLDSGLEHSGFRYCLNVDPCSDYDDNGSIPTKEKLSEDEQRNRKFESLSFCVGPAIQSRKWVKGSFLSDSLRSKFGHLVAPDMSCSATHGHSSSSSGSACFPYLDPIFSNSVVAQLYLARHRNAVDTMGES